MKIVVAGFTTALLVFAVASAISEMLLTSDAPSSSDAAPRRKSNRVIATSESSHSPRKPAKSRPASSAVPESPAPETAESLRLLSEVRRLESAVQSMQDAQHIVFEDIREELQSLDLKKRQFSEEMTAFQKVANQLARRESPIPPGRPTSAAASRPVTLQPTARPSNSLGGRQAVHDRAVLVKRLAQEGSTREATLLIRNLNDRDAAKVLSELAAADSQLAERLSHGWLMAKDAELLRR